MADTKQTTQSEKCSERDWIRDQIDKFYYDAYPVSTILNVNINLEHTEKDELKIKFVKHAMLELLETQLRTGITCRGGHVHYQKIRVAFEASKASGDLPQFWISRDGHLEFLKAQYVKTIVDHCNAEFKKWVGVKHHWQSVTSASIAFLIMRPIDFKELVVLMPK